MITNQQVQIALQMMQSGYAMGKGSAAMAPVGQAALRDRYYFTYPVWRAWRGGWEFYKLAASAMQARPYSDSEVCLDVAQIMHEKAMTEVDMMGT